MVGTVPEAFTYTTSMKIDKRRGYLSLPCHIYIYNYYLERNG
jgi:hypothetical protein